MTLASFRFRKGARFTYAYDMGDFWRHEIRVEGGLEHFVRIPWTRPAEELEVAVDRLAHAWASVGNGRVGDGEGADRLTVA